MKEKKIDHPFGRKARREEINKQKAFEDGAASAF